VMRRFVMGLGHADVRELPAALLARRLPPDRRPARRRLQPCAGPDRPV
jgi:hypothetical protein